MLIYLLGFLFIGLSLAWFACQYKKERRTLWLGVSFLSALLGLAVLLALIAINIPESLFTRGLIILGIIFAVLLLLFPLVMVTGLITTGLQLIRKEGGGLSHILSLGFGIAYLAYLIIWPLLENAFDNPFYSFVYACLSFCFLFALSAFALYAITNLLNLIKAPGKHYQYILVLGSGLKEGHKVPPLLAARVNQGIAAHRENKGSLLLLSGGQGADEQIPEGLAMKNYALSQGVRAESILVEDQSASTRENLMYSKKIIDACEKEGNILVVSSRYHILRALLLARSLGFACEGRGAKTRLYFSVNAFIREWIAYLVFKKKPYLSGLAIGLAVISLFYFVSAL